MAFINRFTTVDTGAITLIGNTLGLSSTVNTNDAGVSGTIGAFVDANISTAANATWPNGTTFAYTQNASTAILNIPPTATILYAELCWGGNYLTRDQNIQASLNNPVTFVTPLGSNSITPDPATAQDLPFPGPGGITIGMYSRSANVTALVQAIGNGSYTCGGVPGLIDPLNASTGDTDCCGWTLAVAYHDFSMPFRQLQIYAGITIISTTINPFTDVTLSGFNTPSNGNVNGRILISAMEGDAIITGDQVLYGPNVGSLTNISGPNNPVNNFFGSQINNDSGNLNTTGTFGTRNQNPFTATNISAGRQGWDITNVDASSALTNNQTSAVMRLTTTGDTYLPSVLGLQIDVNSATFTNNYKIVDKTVAGIGDTVTYTFPLKNIGTTTANQVYLIDTIPNGSSFIPNSVTINGVTSAGAAPSPPGISVGNIGAGLTSTVTFKVLVNTIPTPNPMPNTADLTFNFLSAPGLTAIYGSINSNTVYTQVNYVTMSSTKSVNTNYAMVGDILTYTIVYYNSGNITALDIIIKDTIPNDTQLVTNSVTYNGVTQTGATVAPPTGFFIGTLPINTFATLSFKVTVLTIPSPNPIPNYATSSYDYTLDGVSPKINGGVSTNTVVTQVNFANLSSTFKQVDKTYADLGEKLTYTISIKNTGNVTASNIIFRDTIPNGTTFINNSLTLNSVTQVGANPQSGFTIGQLAPGASATITFSVLT